MTTHWCVVRTKTQAAFSHPCTWWRVCPKERQACSQAAQRPAGVTSPQTQGKTLGSCAHVTTPPSLGLTGGMATWHWVSRGAQRAHQDEYWVESPGMSKDRAFAGHGQRGGGCAPGGGFRKVTWRAGAVPGRLPKDSPFMSHFLATEDMGEVSVPCQWGGGRASAGHTLGGSGPSLAPLWPCEPGATASRASEGVWGTPSAFSGASPRIQPLV